LKEAWLALRRLIPPNLSSVMHPFLMVRTLRAHRQLVKQLFVRDLAQRYRGSYLGFFWSFLTPAAYLAIYTFVFAVVLKTRWQELSGVSSSTSYALALFAGLVPFNVFSEVTNRAPNLILTTPNYVKKIVFPLEVLPVVSLLSALVHGTASLAILLLSAHLLLGPVPPQRLLLLPLAFVPLVFLCLAAGWALASLGVYIRDIGQAVGVVVQLTMFLCPVVYPLSAVPEQFRLLLLVNPLTTTIETIRNLALWDQPPAWAWLATWTVVTAGMAWMSFVWFIKTKRGFADVL
jgi:lipopolysaccharide transport system permease protein